MMQKFRYYRHDGDLFRRAPGQMGAHEILRNKGWEPWKGSPAEPVFYGSEIAEHELPADARGGAPMKYHYFEKEGAVFRRRLIAGERTYPLVDDVKINGEWKPYEGDPQAPVFFGDKITARGSRGVSGNGKPRTIWTNEADCDSNNARRHRRRDAGCHWCWTRRCQKQSGTCATARDNFAIRLDLPLVQPATGAACRQPGADAGLVQGYVNRSCHAHPALAAPMLRR